MSNPVIRGIHHITLCASGAQEDVDFLSQVLGLRLIKQTVLFDGRYAHYHLYYANANAEIGSVLTTFPYRRIPGRPGTGQISATAYTVPKGSLPFWTDHLTRHNVDHGGIQERFFVDALGFRKTGTDGAYHRFEVGSGGAAKTLVLYHEPDRPAGSWGFGAGTGHHLALDVGTDDALAAQKNLYEELGYTDCSEIKDRNYFHSIYVRSPGGILTECAASVPEGFGKDEPIDQLGMELLLPPWFEDRRAEIVAMLEPITVPEANRPAGASTARSARPLQAAEAAVGAGGVAPSRRTTAEFIGGDVPSN